ncbi:MAG TPA: S8 family serine peptidase [Steroidobacteraceae bacterium]|nr:S8 family serine peptidase [Steroidobacteraceae bacterium]
MSAHRLNVAAVALLGIMAASATPQPRPLLKHPMPAAGAAPLWAFGGRSAAQMRSGVGGKLDAALADLARHLGRVRPAHALADLHAMSPAAHFMQRDPGAEPLIAVDAVTRGDPQRLKATLVSLGLVHPAVYLNDVGGWLPVSAIETAAARAEVHSLRAALAHTRGVVATQGDFAQGTATLRASESVLDGSGITVGVLSDSYNCYAVYAANGLPPTEANLTGYAQNGFTADAQSDVSTGALPANVNVLEEVGGTYPTAGSQDCMNYGAPLELPFADEGRAMIQIVHAVAPGAGLAFYTADNSEADFASGIETLATQGAKVIADDVGYYDEPFFQDGIVAQAVDKVEGNGVAYFSAAGNDSNLAYDNATPAFNIAGSGAQAGEKLLNMDATGATSVATLEINVPPLVPGEFIAVVLEWDDPYVTGAPNSGGALRALDLCVATPPSYTIFNLDSNTELTTTATTCSGANAIGSDPVQGLIIGNPANATGNTAQTTVNVTVGLVSGTAPGRVKIAWEDDGAGSQFANFAPTTNATIQGHPGAAGAAAVGAARFYLTQPCGQTPALLEFYSSFGGDPVIFDSAGTRQSQPYTVRQKPDFVAPDGVNTTFFGFTLASAGLTDTSAVAGCADDASYPNYFGTSAATPHAAGLAALMLQANAALTPTQIYTAMRSTAAPMDTPSPDLATGFGFLQAGAAMAALPAGAIVSVSPTTISAGQSATVTWNGIEATSCSGSGSLSTSATSGSTTVTPTAAGSETFTLSCSNANGSSNASATLTVNAASGGGGGGGTLELWTLLALAGLLTAKLLGPRVTAVRLPRAVRARRGV